MNAITIPAAPHEAARHDKPATLRELIATWRWRMRFRRELAQKASGDPELIEDIGLTEQDVANEIAKPFWRK